MVTAAVMIGLYYSLGVPWWGYAVPASLSMIAVTTRVLSVLKEEL